MGITLTVHKIINKLNLVGERAKEFSSWAVVVEKQNNKYTIYDGELNRVISNVDKYLLLDNFIVASREIPNKHLAYEDQTDEIIVLVRGINKDILKGTTIKYTLDLVYKSTPPQAEVLVLTGRTLRCSRVMLLNKDGKKKYIEGNRDHFWDVSYYQNSTFDLVEYVSGDHFRNGRLFKPVKYRSFDSNLEQLPF